MTLLLKFNQTILIILIYSSILTLSSTSYAFESIAKSALVVDDLTNTVLLEKNASMKIPPASLSKLMTLYMIFDALRDERILLTDKIRISKIAAEKGGSKMFLNEGQLVSVEDIIRGIIIHSGNDACIAIAEALSGTEAEFAANMNTEAEIIGLKNSFFSNSTGWPHKDHYMSAEDLINLATKIRIEFPTYYKYFSENTFTWNDITQTNRNPLLNKGIGVDGLKTGHTKEAGYGLVGSAARGARRITFVISGLSSSKERLVESEKITNWAFRDFTALKITSKGTVIGKIPTWLGEKKMVSLVAKDDVFILIPTKKNAEIQTYIKYDTAIEAPFKAGSQSQAKLIVEYNKTQANGFSKEFNLITGEGSEVGSFLIRFQAAITIFKNALIRMAN